MKRFVTLILLLLAFTVPVVAQSIPTSGDETVSFLEQWYVSVAAMSAAVLAITQFIKPYLNKKWLVVLMSWLLGVVLALFGWSLNLGYLENLPIWQAILYGLVASGMANGTFDLLYNVNKSPHPTGK